MITKNTSKSAPFYAKGLLMALVIFSPFVYSSSYAHCKAWHPHHCAPVTKKTGTAVITFTKFEVKNVPKLKPGCKMFQVYFQANNNQRKVLSRGYFSPLKKSYLINQTHRVQVGLKKDDYLKLTLGYQYGKPGQKCFSSDKFTLSFSPLTISKLRFVPQRSDGIDNNVRLYYKIEVK